MKILYSALKLRSPSWLLPLVQRLYFPAVIPVKTGILELEVMPGVAIGAEIPAFAGMTAYSAVGLYGVRNTIFTKSCTKKSGWKPLPP